MRYAICDMRYAIHGMAVNAVNVLSLNVNIQKLKSVSHVPRGTSAVHKKQNLKIVPRGTSAMQLLRV